MGLLRGLSFGEKTFGVGPTAGSDGWELIRNSKRDRFWRMKLRREVKWTGDLEARTAQ